MTARRFRWFGLALAAGLPALAAPEMVVTQVGRAFSIRAIQLKRGDMVRFRNADEFLHQLYVRSASFNFSSAEQESGQSIEMRFPVAGTFEVRCEIHPKMRLAVTVD